MQILICVLFCVFCKTFDVVTGACDKFTGPPAVVECVTVPNHSNMSQLATCLKASYIRAKSGDKHFCKDSSADQYCWYQCMCEVHDKCNSLDVEAPCSCSRKQTIKPVPLRMPLLPWCFGPDGERCSWYTECLAKRHQCAGTLAEFTITFSQTFCDLYSNHKESFSPDGQLWINAVRKCLQVELVPTLRPWLNFTCSGIKDIAFASHTKCYAGAESEAAFCSIDFFDRWRVFWTIRSAFELTWTCLDSMKELFDMTFACFGGIPEGFNMNRIKVHVEEEIDPKLYGEIVDIVADNQDWRSKGVDWFWFYSKTMQTTASGSAFDVVLASRSVYNLNAWNVPETNVTEIVMKLADSLEKGFPSFVTIDDIQVDIQSMAACSDLACNSIYLDIKANIVYSKGTGLSTGASAWTLAFIWSLTILSG